MEQITVSKKPEVRKIVEGRADTGILQMLMQKKLGFTDEEYLECFAFALTYDDLREDARMRLQEIPESVKHAYVQKRDANELVMQYIVDEALGEGNAALLIAVVQNKWVAESLLLRIAEKAPAPVLEAMTGNPLALVATPEIMELIGKNAQATDLARERIAEIRMLFFEEEKEKAASPAPAAQPAAAASASAAPIPSAARSDSGAAPQVMDQNMTALQRIMRMNVSDKIRLAFKGSKTERLILMKDPNKLVQTAVIDSPKLSDEEVISFINDRSTPGEIIQKIADNRDWTRSYVIVLALAQNPKVPVGRATSFLKQLHERDLKALTLDRNINPVVRNLALTLFKTRSDHK